MKRFWLVMLSLGLVLAFSAYAFAVDVKFSGSFYAAGMYLDKTNVQKEGGSDCTAFYYQRLRLQTDFIVSPGLKLVTRFDAMERAWGAPRSTPTDDYLALNSPATYAEKENIGFDWAYVSWTSAFGELIAGYKQEGVFGTAFADYAHPVGVIQFGTMVGPVALFGYMAKVEDLSNTAKYSSRFVDNDHDQYVLGAIWNINKNIEVGALVAYDRIAGSKPDILDGGLGPGVVYGMLTNVYAFDPYFKAKVGPVSLEGELQYIWGKAKWEDNAATSIYYPTYIGTDVDISQLSIYLSALVDVGPVYFGGSFAYLSGDDPVTTDKQEGGLNNGGTDWNPCLIMFNTYDVGYWVGGVNTPSGVNTGAMTNAWFAQGKVGVKPIAGLDINASLAWAQADKKPAALWANKGYGTELDITGTYKITNNLSYMLGVGYWFVGDFYKGPGGDVQVKDDYLVINKLTLTF